MGDVPREIDVRFCHRNVNAAQRRMLLGLDGSTSPDGAPVRVTGWACLNDCRNCFERRQAQIDGEMRWGESHEAVLRKAGVTG